MRVKFLSVFLCSIVVVISARAQRTALLEKKPLFKKNQCVSGNCVTGIGTAKNDNGDLYYGSWLKGLPHGLGTVYFDLENPTYPPGTFFTGKFAYGLIDGMGTFDFPGEKRTTVRFDKSPDFAVFEDLGNMRPRKRRHVIDDSEDWDGWKIRQKEFFDSGRQDRLMVNMSQYYEGIISWSTIGNSGPVEILFLIDTGCSGTALTNSTLNYLRNNGIRVTEVDKGYYDTACGPVEFTNYEIESLTLGGVTFHNVPVTETFSSTNLLGMEILGSFGTIVFNSEHETLVLE